MPDTLPTVTSSTITGEFWGSVATSGSATVILYEPEPCPDVPGMSSEFSPPNEQPASSVAPAEIATVRWTARDVKVRRGLRITHLPRPAAGPRAAQPVHLGRLVPARVPELL